MVSFFDYAKFVVDIIAATAPDVIRLSDTHVATFLPFVCHPAAALYIVVEFPCGPKSEPLSQIMELFPPYLWKIEQLTPALRGGYTGHIKSRMTTFVAKLA